MSLHTHNSHCSTLVEKHWGSPKLQTAPVTEMQLVPLDYITAVATGCTKILYFNFMEDVIIKHRIQINL
jgi:hypothetical protein